MKEIVISGKDWSSLDDTFNYPENIDRSSALQKYFPRYKNLFGHELSPFNLGIYQTAAKNENDGDVLKSTKYIGVMPLLARVNDSEKKPDNCQIIKVISRFGISPTAMLKEVLAGKDYYETPDMFKIKSYNLNEWKKTSNTNIQEKVLFGVINGIGKIDLSACVDGNSDGHKKSDLGIADSYGVFEIIDFLSKAKEICKKSLKKQSKRVEENLNCKVKGRILVQKQIKNNVVKGQIHKTFCAYNKMSSNIKENQIIKYALHICKKHEIGDSLSEDIRFCMNALNDVPLKKCCISDFVGLKNNGAFKEYKEALLSAKKVIGRYALAYENGKESDTENETKALLVNHQVLPYFIDMNLLFEYYCRALFKKVIDSTELKKSYSLERAKEAKRLLFSCDENYSQKAFAYLYNDEEDNENLSDNNSFRNFFMAQYIPDIVILDERKITSKNNKRQMKALTIDDNRRHTKPVAMVIDAKYSDVEKTEKRARTHQVVFYMNALGCNSGGIISPSKAENKDKELYFFAQMHINDDYQKAHDKYLVYLPIRYWEKEINEGFIADHSELMNEILSFEEKHKRKPSQEEKYGIIYEMTIKKYLYSLLEVQTNE